MNTTTHRRMSVLWVLALAASLMLLAAAAGTAWAQPPIVGTEVTRLSPETFSDEPVRCQTELYTITFTNGLAVEHFTYFPDTGALHYHLMERGKIVAVPLDGTGPSYTGNFRVSDSENIRSVKQGEVLVETDTDLDRFVAKGSDGSRAFFKFHAHFTYNANGEVTVDLDTSRLVCSG
jgi:hypothetical protein